MISANQIPATLGVPNGPQRRENPNHNGVNLRGTCLRRAIAAYILIREILSPGWSFEGGERQRSRNGKSMK